jgi:hypothetical protein
VGGTYTFITFHKFAKKIWPKLIKVGKKISVPVKKNIVLIHQLPADGRRHVGTVLKCLKKNIHFFLMS